MECMGKGTGKNVRANCNGDRPQVDSSAYIDASAQIIGNVRIGAGVFVGPGAVVRADEVNDTGQVEAIEIGARSNVQDGVIIHAVGGAKVSVGEGTSLAHGCVIHGPCSIGDGCFIGFRAVVYKATLGDGVFVSAGAVVEGVDLDRGVFIPAGSVVLSQEDVLSLAGKVSSADKEFMERVVKANLALAKGYSERCS
ncbi:MAG: carbonate dehydratase [Planctomycetes bacterium]|nr:carbonate dehydratase [Planctomycetota bacterium]